MAVVQARRAALLCSITLTLAPGTAFGQAATLKPIPWQGGAGAALTPDAEPAKALDTATAGGKKHVLLQFDKLPTETLKAELRRAGLTLQSWLGENAYFAAVRAEGVDAAALGAIRTPVAIRPIEVNWKLHPMFVRSETPAWAEVPPPEGDASERMWIAAYVLFHDDQSLNDAALALQAIGTKVIDRMPSVHGLVIETPLADAGRIAALDGVKWLEPALPPLIENNDSNRVITQADIVQSAPYGLTGAGVNVMVYDGGFARATHLDFQGRLTVRDASGLSNHATHVAGTIGGGGIANALFRGMAPGVTIQSYGFEQPGGLSQGFLYTNPGDLEADYTNARNVHGAVIANNSIGTNTASNGFPCSWEGDYGVTSALIDAIVRGSLGGPMRIVFANGNERSSGRCGTAYHTTAPPACAKNHITVGALNSNNDSVTTFTSWGPTDDGRLKPDISAPGCQQGGDAGVTSCASTGDSAYTVFCGTSMASPTVTGLSALLIQDFRAQFPGQPDPRNSTLKILLAHNAQDIDAVGPDYKSGYGSVRIQRTVDFLRSGQFVEGELSHGGVYRLTIPVPAGTPELKVTLAWDDAPAAPNVVGTIVNDLDIVLLDPTGTQHFPWTLGGLANPAAPAVRTAADHVNNIEQVFVETPTSGAWILEIRGFNVPVGPQPFSLCYTPAASNDCNNNGIDDLQDIASGTSQDCNNNLLPDECESPADCNNNGQRDFCDIFGGASLDRNLNRIPDECEPDCNNNGSPDDWDVSSGLSPDCNNNGRPDECDVSGGTSLDCNSNNIPDECEVDCNHNNIPDACDIAGGFSVDCNLDGIPDECGLDCNQNRRHDSCDISSGESEDCDEDGVPDECEAQTDCNNNGERDFCDIYTGASTDVNSNAIPDDCEPDCNNNDIPDAWDISIGGSPDCNGNGKPDECDLADGTSQDCNNNLIPDSCDIDSGFSDDCNGNAIPDSCDIASGFSLDCNNNGTPDECDISAGVPDCNANGIPDSCDIASGFSSDCNNNGVPDSCDNDCNQNGIADECDIASGFSRDLNGDGYPDECVRLYVNDDATGNGSGATWQNAMTSLDAAVAESMNNLGLREIWVAAGTYRPSSASAYVLRPNLAVIGGFAGTETSALHRNIAANLTLVGPSGIGPVRHVFTLTNATGVVLDGVRISNGFGSGADRGGGVLINGGSPTIRNCEISHNWSGGGGGSFVQSASPTFADCVFLDNISQTGDGGAIATQGNGTLTVSGCRFEANYCRESGGGLGRGGAIYCAPGYTLSVDRSQFIFNRALNFSRVARAEGGGIANYSPTTTIRNSLFTRNEASAGGGIYSLVPMTIVNSVFTGNKSADPNDLAFDAGEGGGIFGEPGALLTLVNCTIAANWAEKKAAGASTDGFYRNCIFWHNAVLVNPGDTPEPLVDQQFQGDAEISYSDIAGLLGGGGANGNFPGCIETNPLFVVAPTMTASGVFTAGDLHLRSGSPCLDAGDNSELPPNTTTDFDGLARRYDDPAAPNTGVGTSPHVDMGAFERQPPPCFGDLNGNHAVDGPDLAILAASIGAIGPALPGDLNSDATIDIEDVAILQRLFGRPCPQ